MSKAATKEVTKEEVPQGPMIFSKMIEVMKLCSAITKTRKNTAQGYNFRGIDDVYNELHPLMAQAGVFTATEVLEERTEERTKTKEGWNGAPATVTTLIYRVLKVKFTFYAVDGSSIDVIVIGEGMDTGDKAANKAMAVAHKYALMQAFAIPTDEAKDPENDSHNVDPKKAPLAAAPIQQVKEAPAQKPVQKAKGGYDGSPEMAEKLKLALMRQGVEEIYWPEIDEEMKGKTSQQLFQVIKNVKARHVAPIQPTGALAPEEIPF